MKNKNLILAAVAIAAIAAILLGVFLATRPETTQGAKTITVTVVHADGSSKDFTYNTDEEYLGPVLVAEGLIEPAASPGMYDTVDGEKADWNVDQSYWGFYVNGEYAMYGMDDTLVNDGDVYKLEYTIG